MSTTRPLKKLWEIYDITSSKRVFQSEWKSSWVPFYRAREIVKLAKNWYVDNELYISEEMYNEYAKKYWIPKENDIMVTWVGTIWICYFVKKDDKFYFKDGNIIWFKSQDKTVDSRFIEYAFKSNNILNQINNSAGSVVATLTIEKAKNIQIPLPPLATQHAIVTKLDETFAEIDAAIKLTEENIRNTDEMTKSVLNTIFEEGDWEKKKMWDKDIMEIIDWDRWTNYPKKEEFLEDWYCLFLNTWNVRQWFFDLDDKQFISKEKDEVLRKWKLQLDDIILTTRWTIWNSAHYNKDIPYKNLRINSWMVLLRTNKKVILPEYLLKFITAPFFHKQRLSMASWSAQPQLPIGTLNNIEIPLPPLAKQTELVAYLDTVFDQTKTLKTAYEVRLLSLKELKASTLQHAFEGKLI